MMDVRTPDDTHVGPCLLCWFSSLAIYDERWWPAATEVAYPNKEGPCCGFIGGYAGDRHKKGMVDTR